MPGVRLILTAGGRRPSRRRALPRADRRTATARRATSPTSRCSRSGVVKPCRRRGRLRRRRHPRRRPATPRRRSRSTTRSCRRSVDMRAGGRRPARRWSGRRPPATSPTTPAMGDKDAVDAAFATAARVVSLDRREQPPGRQLHGDPRRRRRIRCRDRALHADPGEPGRARPARHARRRRSSRSRRRRCG